ncbi:MAG: rod shape-determining protein MreC [Acidobacteria bacterium]|nr:rod shape-determining protein MreC [Acidobacteriota bacterium]
MLVIVTLAAHLALLSTQIPKVSSTPMLRTWAMEFVLPFLRGTVGGISSLGGLWEDYVRLRVDKKEHERLKSQVEDYRQTLLVYKEEVLRLKRLETLDLVKSALNRPGVAANVIGGDDRMGFSSRVVDKGASSGISWDCPVINAEGVVGRVVHVSRNSAVVQLISDLDSGVGILLETSRATGVLRGTGRQTATIHYVPLTEKASPGERVITSGLDRIYPKGLLVGNVLSATSGQTGSQQVRVAISARMKKLEEVLILKKESTG